ncbi:MAG: TonB family protein [Bacteroidetes bacterium]|nr:TonB family protein [Bacteroidota bacterium]
MMKRCNFGIFLILSSFLYPVTSWAQEMIPAQPRGGEWWARQFIDDEMLYPAGALKNSIEGTVVFSFIVTDQGVVKDLNQISKTDPILNTEAMRIFRMMIWQPAQYRGKAVESKVNFEIPFTIKHYKRACRERGYQTIDFPNIPLDTSGIVYQYKYADLPPSPLFESKEMNMQQFLAENFRYPEQALRTNISGVVRLNLIVEPHGHISNLMVVEHLGAGCTEEAIRLVRLIKWKPGIKDGFAVRVSINIPIKFGLSDDGNYKVTPALGGTTFQ